MPPLIELHRDFNYESAHQLPMVPEGHKCGRMHGHSYHLKVTVRGPIGYDGFVTDFADMDAIIAPIIKELDHHNLNDILENPTVEWQLVWLWDRLRDLPWLHELTLQETDRNSATYRGVAA